MVSAALKGDARRLRLRDDRTLGECSHSIVIYLSPPCAEARLRRRLMPYDVAETSPPV